MVDVLDNFLKLKSDSVIISDEMMQIGDTIVIQCGHTDTIIDEFGRNVCYDCSKIVESNSLNTSNMKYVSTIKYSISKNVKPKNNLPIPEKFSNFIGDDVLKMQEYIFDNKIINKKLRHCYMVAWLCKPGLVFKSDDMLILYFKAISPLDPKQLNIILTKHNINNLRYDELEEIYIKHLIYYMTKGDRDLITICWNIYRYVIENCDILNSSHQKSVLLACLQLYLNFTGNDGMFVELTYTSRQKLTYLENVFNIGDYLQKNTDKFHKPNGNYE